MNSIESYYDGQIRLIRWWLWLGVFGVAELLNPPCTSLYYVPERTITKPLITKKRHYPDTLRSGIEGGLESREWPRVKSRL